MMRGPRNWAVAVRKPDGEIAQVGCPIDSPMARHWALRLPIVRGVVALGESLAIGFRALSVSANYATPTDDGEGGRRGGRDRPLDDRLLVRDRDRLRARSSSRSAPACSPTRCRSTTARWFVLVEGADPDHRLRRLPRRCSACSRRSSACSSTTPPSTRRSTPTRPARSSRPRWRSATR